MGQNVNAYRGSIAGSSEIADFAMLLEYVAEIPGVERIRFTTSHPKEFTQRLIDAYTKSNEFGLSGLPVDQIIFKESNLCVFMGSAFSGS